MAVAHDAVRESHTGTTGVASVASFTWNHVPTGTPRSVLVFTFAVGANPVTGVTYGGVSMTAVPYTAYDSDTEPGFVQAWFLDNVAAGTQAVVVSRTNNAVVTYGVSITQTAAAACEVYLPGVVTQACGTSNTAASSSATGTGTAGLKSVNDGSPGTDSQRYMAMHYGGSSVLAAGTGSTTLSTGGAIDYGLYVQCTYRETTPGQGTRNVGSAAGTDDLALIALAVREVPVDNRNANVTATGGGIATEVSTKGATRANPATGGGVVAIASTGAHNKAVAATGSGIAALAPAGAHVRSVAAAGGGVAVASIRKGAVRAAVATGGGVAAAAPRAGRQAAVIATGGGVASLSVQSARSLAALLSGGGVLTSTQTTSRRSVVTSTGGGTAVVAASTAENHNTSIAASASGRASVSIAAAHQLAVALTGGGAAVLGVTSSHCAFLEATGAGVAIVDGRGRPDEQMPGLAAAVRILAASAGEAEIAGAPAMSVVCVPNAPVITSARVIP